MVFEDFSNMPPGPPKVVEDYFLAWSRTTAGNSMEGGSNVEYTDEAVVFTCDLEKDFDALMNIHNKFATYPDYVSVIFDKNRLTFTFSASK